MASAKANVDVTIGVKVSPESLLGLSQAWAIRPEYLSGMCGSAESLIAGRQRNPFKGATSGTMAILPLSGPLDKRSSWMLDIFGGTSTDEFGVAFDAAVANPQVASILIVVDSPGGTVYGVQELADKIYNARSKKPSIAISDPLMASAAYWIASSAGTLMASPSSEVGSIGVVAMHIDQSKADSEMGVVYTYITGGENKAELNEHEPLKDESRAYLQGRVDDYYAAFLAAVSRNRDVPKSEVLKNFGQGRVFGAQQALSVGMVDGITTTEELMSRWIGQQTKGMRSEQLRRLLDLRFRESGL